MPVTSPRTSTDVSGRSARRISTASSVTERGRRASSGRTTNASLAIRAGQPGGPRLPRGAGLRWPGLLPGRVLPAARGPAPTRRCRQRAAGRPPPVRPAPGRLRGRGSAPDLGHALGRADEPLLVDEVALLLAPHRALDDA